MNVLITGGYGFIGSHVADKLFRDGHEIYIADNLSSGKAENISISHKFFKYDVSDRQIENIFRDNHIDAVVHLAAQASVAVSLDDPYIDTRSNILGTANMLFLSAKYGIKKFIFASSAAVYGNNEDIPLNEKSMINPVSPYGLSKYTCELYCRKWSEIYGLDTLCFRFSNVYGPRQGMSGEGGVVSIFIRNLLENQPLLIYGDGCQTRDFIYIEDLANAISKALVSKCSGILNLSANTENSINELAQILMDIMPEGVILHMEKRSGDIYRSKLDNSRARQTLKWSPEHTFREGIKKTVQWYASQGQS